MKNGNQNAICVITWPLGNLGSEKAFNSFLLNLITILNPLTGDIYVLSQTNITFDQNIQLFNINAILSQKKLITQIINNIFYQLSLCKKIFKLRKQVDIYWIFGGTILLLPIILIKLLNKKIIINELLRESQRIEYAYKWGFILKIILGIQEHLSYILCNFIVLESKSIIKYANLQRYKTKIFSQGFRYLDLNIFDVKLDYKNRNDKIGFIARISNEKGIMNLLESFKQIEALNDFIIIIAGTGPLKNELKDKIKTIKKPKIKYIDWVERDEIPSLLNELKFLVLPSDAEGLPTIITEAMACGTPIIATPVGGINDVLIDGYNGFLIKNNKPETIAEGFERALKHSNLDLISKNARDFALKNFSYESAIIRYSKIFKQI